MIDQDIQHQSRSNNPTQKRQLTKVLLSFLTLAVIATIGTLYVLQEDQAIITDKHVRRELLTEDLRQAHQNKISVGQEPLEDIPFFNPYEIEYMTDEEYSITGNMLSFIDYDPELHRRAMRRLTSGLKVPHDYTLDPREIPMGENNKLVKNVTFAFDMLDYYRCKLTLTDGNNERYSIPDFAVNKPGVSKTMRTEMMGLKLFHNPFAFQFADLRNSSNLYLTSNQSNLVLMDKFLQIDFELPSQRLFGFGERLSSFQLQEGTWTMWAREPKNCSFDDGTGGKQGYGVHPFVMIQGFQKDDFFGIFFRNSNAQSPLIKYNINGGTTLSYITTGGQLEIEFFIHGNPKTIIQQYLNSIGKPTLPPLWSLGWGQSSYSYTSLDKLQDMIAGYEDNKIPLEHVWLDIPYMKKFEDFTVDQDAFPNLAIYTDYLHSKKMKLVVILDPGLSADDPNSKYYKMAQEQDVLIKSSIHPDKMNGALVAKLFAEQTVFIDWYSINAYDVWSEGLKDLYEQTHFDGLWLDMSEITVFCSGECPKDQGFTVDGVVKRMLSEEGTKNAKIVRDDNSWYYSYQEQDQQSTYYLPFIPGFQNQGNLDSESISLNATHKFLPNILEFTEYDVHNLNGLLESEYTHGFMTQNSKMYPKTDDRAFILSRSTFAGSGRYTSHWLGDNWRDWSYMKQSIAGIMSMNMFGIPHTGADICGFYGEKLDQEMCARWIQLAQFYPLARMHYNQTYKGGPIEGTEPYNLQGEWATVAKNSIYARYQYLRLMYTCLFEAQEDGNTCFDPLFYYYPFDDKTFEDIESTFMVAGALKVSPILQAGVTDTYTSYFPQGRWVSMRDFNEVVVGGQNVQLRPHTTVNVHLRPGKIIPFQDNSDLSMSNTNQLLEKPIQIIANRDSSKLAKGSLLLDRGISRQELQTGHYEYYTFSLQANSLQKYLTKGSHGSQKTVFDRLVILDAEDLRDTDFACLFNAAMDRFDLQFEYDTVGRTLTIKPEEGETFYFFQFRSIHYGSTKKGDINVCDQSAYYLKLKGDKPDLNRVQTSFILTGYQSTIPDVNMTITLMENNQINVHWKIDKLPEGWRQSFEVPEEIIAKRTPRTTLTLDKFIKYFDNHFVLQICARDGAILAQLEEFHLTQFFNQATLQLNSTKGEDFLGIMGLGERVMDNLFYPEGVYTSWNKDSALPFDQGVPPGANVYGSHPFLMYKNSDKIWVGVFINLANAVDWYVQNFKNTGVIKLYQAAIGGVGDYTFILDSNPNEVSASFLSIVGKPTIVPQWALGWHQCKWGYETLDELKEVVNQYEQNNLPLDVQWNDIDYMYSYRDFTYDHLKYDGLDDFIDYLHSTNRRYVPILDAGIAQRPAGNYPPYEFGLDQNAFIKIKDDELLTGQVWPKDAVYVDWFSVNGSHYWQNELYYMQKTLKFDGLWQDMNEASDFCNGICYDEQQVDNPIKYNTFYTPGLRDLEEKQMSLDGQHQNGWVQYDTHNLYGIMMAKSSQKFFQSVDMRTFIISRSSFAGHGKFGQKWLGDNFSEVRYMAASVHGIMMMGVFGIHFVGSDICGFIGDTNPELCARWYGVAAFQPFSRNHNNFGSIPQEPYVFKNEIYEDNLSYTDIIRTAMRTKLCLVRYYYTLLHQKTDVGGPPFYRPLFFDYPNDKNAFQNTTNNVLLGPAIKISHQALHLGVNQTDFYFPPDLYCDIFRSKERCFTSSGKVINMQTKAYDVYAHLRAGNIIPFQDAFTLNANTTVDLQNQPTELHIAGEESLITASNWFASGLYVNDDGLKKDIKGNFNKYQMEALQTSFLGITEIQIQIRTEYATNYKPKDGSNCYAINQNDYLNRIQFYHAKATGTLSKFSIEVTYVNGTVTKNGEANYDEESDRLIADIEPKVCLPAVALIKLNKL